MNDGDKGVSGETHVTRTCVRIGTNERILHNRTEQEWPTSSHQHHVTWTLVRNNKSASDV